jgi:hypothetical protein
VPVAASLEFRALGLAAGDQAKDLAELGVVDLGERGFLRLRLFIWAASAGGIERRSLALKFYF